MKVPHPELVTTLVLQIRLFQNSASGGPEVGPEKKIHLEKKHQKDYE
jgi:hypothetical protein